MNDKKAGTRKLAINHANEWAGKGWKQQGGISGI